MQQQDYWLLYVQHHLAGPQAGAASPSALSEAIRFAISMAVMAASPPLLPTFPPALSRACVGSNGTAATRNRHQLNSQQPSPVRATAITASWNESTEHSTGRYVEESGGCQTDSVTVLP